MAKKDAEDHLIEAFVKSLSDEGVKKLRDHLYKTMLGKHKIFGVDDLDEDEFSYQNFKLPRVIYTHDRVFFLGRRFVVISFADNCHDFDDWSEFDKFIPVTRNQLSVALSLVKEISPDARVRLRDRILEIVQDNACYEGCEVAGEIVDLAILMWNSDPLRAQWVLGMLLGFVGVKAPGVEDA